MNVNQYVSTIGPEALGFSEAVELLEQEFIAPHIIQACINNSRNLSEWQRKDLQSEVNLRWLGVNLGDIPIAQDPDSVLDDTAALIATQADMRQIMHDSLAILPGDI